MLPFWILDFDNASASENSVLLIKVPSFVAQSSHASTFLCNERNNAIRSAISASFVNAIYFLLYILFGRRNKAEWEADCLVASMIFANDDGIKYIGAISKAEKRKCAKWKQTSEHLLLLHCTEQLLGTNSMVCKSWQHITRQRQQFNTDHLAFAC